MSKAFTVEELAKGSADFQRLNAAVVGGPAPAMQERKPPKKAAKEIIQAKTRLDSCNKTELRFYREWLWGEEDCGNVVIVQPPRFFELEGGGTYTPDFIVVDGAGIRVYEVKGAGHYPGWEQGIERFKRVAAQYSCSAVSFKLATWDKGQWRIEEWLRK